MEYTVKFEINKKDMEYGILTVDGENSKVSYTLYKENNTYEILSFLAGRAFNTCYCQDRTFKKSYSKEGRGKEALKAKEEIRTVVGIANYYDGIKEEINKKVNVITVDGILEIKEV